MTKRPIFLLLDKQPYYRTYFVSFDWNGGFAKSQKVKNINALHNGYQRIKPDAKLMEISSASTEELGIALSAFNLKKLVPSLKKEITVECLFQGGKVFENGGPYLDLLSKTSKEAKKDSRIRSSGNIIAFEYEGNRYPTEPKTAFYDWLYINACLEHPELVDGLNDYAGFTDIEFNPDKSLNCQARALAILCSLKKQNLLADIKDFEKYVKLVYSK